MWGILATVGMKLVDLVLRLRETAKVNVEVKEFHFDRMDNEPGSSVVLVTPYPTRYYTNLIFSNVGRRLTTVKEIVILVNGKPKLYPSVFEPIRIEPGGLCEKVVIFPVDTIDAPARGSFEIHVFDTFAKKSKCKGHFPLRTTD